MLTFKALPFSCSLAEPHMARRIHLSGPHTPEEWYNRQSCDRLARPSQWDWVIDCVFQKQCLHPLFSFGYAQGIPLLHFVTHD